MQRREPRSEDGSKKGKVIYVFLTMMFLLVIGLTALIVCWSYYKWEWATVAYWLNPFSEGNNYALIIYLGIAVFLFALIGIGYATYRQRRPK